MKLTSACITPGFISLLVILGTLFEIHTFASVPLASPELEIISAINRLDKLKKRRKSENNLATSKGYGTGPVSASRAFDIAIDAYEMGEYLSTQRNLQYYFENTNIPDHRVHSKAYLFAAKASKKLGQVEKSYDYYLEFLGLSSREGTAEDIEIRNAIADVLEITAFIKPRKKSHLAQILSAVITMETSEELKSEILFLSAKSATNFGMSDMAEKWLNQTLKKKEASHKTRLRGYYYQALIDISNNNLEAAKSKLKTSLELRDKATVDEISIINIALARIEYTTENYNEAIKHFLSVSSKSNSYPDASYELIYAYYKGGQITNAYEQAKKFVLENPNHDKISFADSLISYLGIKSGVLDKTENDIKKDMGFLINFTKEIQSKLTNRVRIDDSDLLKIRSQTLKFANQSPYLERSIKIFSKLENLESLSAKIQSKISNLIINLWDARLHDIMPLHIERSEQIKKIVYELLDIGHRLSASEFRIAEDHLQDEDKITMKRSTQRRVSLLSSFNEFRRYQENTVSLARALDVNSNIEKLYDTKNMIRSQINAINYRLLDKSQNTLKVNLNTLNTKYDDLSKKISKLVIDHRNLYLKNIFTQSPLTMTKELMLTYTLDLLTESKVMASWRDRGLNPIIKKISWKFHDAWIKWFDTADVIFNDIIREQTKVKKSSRRLIDNISALQNRKNNLLSQTHEIRDLLTRKLGQDAFILANHYSNASNRSLSKKKEWLADIEWLKFQNIEAESRHLNQTYKSKRRELNENLNDQMRGIDINEK